MSPSIRASSRPVRVVALLALLVARQAAAQDYEAAGRHFKAAQAAYAKGEYSRAADEFDQAWFITKDPVLLFNVGDSYERAGNPRGAVRYYRSYLSEQPKATDRAAVEKRIAALEAAHGIAPPAPASPTPPSPGAPSPPAAPAPPAATSPSPPPSPPAVTVPAGAAGQGASLTPASAAAPSAGSPAPSGAPLAPSDPAAAPAPIAPPPAPIAPPPAPIATPPVAAEIPAAPAAASPTVANPPGGLLDGEAPTRLRTAAWVCVAATVALATAGAIFGLAAQSRGDEISRREKQIDVSTMMPPDFNATTEADFKGLYSDGRTFEAAGISLLAGAAAVAVVSGALFFTDWRRRVGTKPVAISPLFGDRQAGVAARWDF